MILRVLLLVMLTTACRGQDKPLIAVGGPCEGCEATVQYGDTRLMATDTIPGYRDMEPKIKLTGTVYQEDGTTPAEGVILYFHQTNRDGIYPPPKGSTGWARRHGKHRAWLKTGVDGKYTLYTFRPGSYPNRAAHEHIHIFIKEPGKTPYYIDDYVFDDDPLLTERARSNLRKLGGSGLVTIQEGGLVERDIILGKNIRNYQ